MPFRWPFVRRSALQAALREVADAHEDIDRLAKEKGALRADLAKAIADLREAEAIAYCGAAPWKDIAAKRLEEIDSLRAKLAGADGTIKRMDRQIVKVWKAIDEARKAAEEPA
jgi:hypothetical protein